MCDGIVRSLRPAFHASGWRRRSIWRRWRAWSLGWIWLGAVQLAWAGNAGQLPTHGKPAARAAAAVPPAMPVTAAPAIQSPADMAARLAAADCKVLRLDPAPLAALQQILHPLGLAVRILGCPEAPAPLNQRVLAVTAVVLDGDKAMDTVRGALGDGEPVDMGSDYHPSPWPSRQRSADLETLDDSEVSPDVQFNRRWLRSVMASQGYASVTGPWWAFIPVQQRRR
ncbi:MAG: M15 family metallopeptidase [Comamonas sp.]